MKKIGLYVAGIALGLHGIIEITALFLYQTNFNTPKFAFEQLQNNIQVTCILGAVFGLARLIAAFGVLRNRQWGLALGVLLSSVTYVIMTLYLPMGISDGILSGIVLVSLLITYYGKKPIVE